MANTRARPDLSAFLRGAAITYDGIHNGKVVHLEAKYSRPADLPVAQLQIRKIGHRRAMLAIMMSEVEVSAFFINLNRGVRA
jgi:hypothetical protein